MRRALERTLALQPKHADAELALATWHAEAIARVGRLLAMTQGADATKALQHYRRALELNPTTIVGRGRVRARAADPRRRARRGPRPARLLAGSGEASSRWTRPSGWRPKPRSRAAATSAARDRRRAVLARPRQHHRQPAAASRTRARSGR
ncbi:MAG: hypothetical protein MZW92_63080 [Comamonadaceae bacterium]|nr:hypothetical protein [Comamonadaceae bacterium]